MSTHTWTAPGSNAALLFVGRLRFEDIATPVPSKNEWGIDVLERTMRGPVYLLDSFCKSLRQGQQYAGFYLQSWLPSLHPYAPTVTLLYKGLIGGVPDPLISNQRCEVISSRSASGLSVSYNDKTITSASQEVKYNTPQTVYRYISTTEPTVPRYSVARGQGVAWLDSRITVNYDDGTSEEFRGNAPAGVVIALFENPQNFVIGPASSRIFGTPYWECEDLVQLRYPD